MGVNITAREFEQGKRASRVFPSSTFAPAHFPHSYTLSVNSSGRNRVLVSEAAEGRDCVMLDFCANFGGVDE